MTPVARPYETPPSDRNSAVVATAIAGEGMKRRNRVMAPNPTEGWGLR